MHSELTHTLTHTHLLMNMKVGTAWIVSYEANLRVILAMTDNGEKVVGQQIVLYEVGVQRE